MSHAAKIIEHSISPDGVELMTMEVVMPRIILSEFNTHRVFSRNSASSRAIPIQKMIRRVMEDPYVPSSWGKNQKGMQAGEEVSKEAADQARYLWLGARDAAVRHAEELLKQGIHKQLTNRLLEPFMWHTVIVTSTEWSNFYHLRDNAKAHPDIQTCAKLMKEAHEASTPNKLDYGNWHLPYIQKDEFISANTDEMLVKVSSARCARVSYLTHDGKRELRKDLELYDDLLQPGHMSPFEHPARPATPEDDNICLAPMTAGSNEVERMWFGNFRGWVSHRKTIPHESDILGHRK